MLKGIVKGNNLLNENIFSDADSTHINYMKSNPVTLSASVTYTFSCNVSCNGLYIRDVSNDDNIASGNNVSSVSYTPDNDIQVYFRIWNNSGVTGLQPMVNEGSTSLPYEPYQTVHDISRIPMRSKNLAKYWKNAYVSASGVSPQEKNAMSYPVFLKSGDRVRFATTTNFSRGLGSFESFDGTNLSNLLWRGTSNNIDYTATVDCYIVVWVNLDNSATMDESKFNDCKPMLVFGGTVLPYVPYGMVEGWEVRDQQGRIIWGADKTLTGTDSIPFKGYGLDIKEYDIDGNMVQAAEKAYSITGTSPLDFQSNGSNATISISGNETQASNQAYTTSGTSPLSFNADGTNLTALSMDGNMNQASSQPYTVSGTSPISFMNNGTAIDYTVSGNMNQTGTPTPTSPITPQECGERTNQLIPYPYYSPDDVYDGVTFTTNGNKIVASGTTSTGYNFFLWRVDKFPAGTYTLSVTGTHTGASIYVRDVTNSVTIASIFGGQTGDRQVAFTTTEELQVYVYINSSGSGTVDFNCSIMLNEGSTALPYEPNLYKVPLTIAGNTQNTYIKEPLRKIGDYSDIVNSDGSVTRNIIKVVYDGTETWEKSSSRVGSFYTFRANNVRNSISYCDRAVNADVLNDYSYGCVFIEQAGNTIATNLWLFDQNMTKEDFKAYLTSEYSAGHPVEVWYVLSTPQTDTATTPTITPTSGNNTLSVDTTLAPSNITITSNSSVFPGNPITPIECGVKTENLLSEKYENRSINGSGAFAIDNNYDLWIGEVISGQTYTISNLDYVYGFFTSKPAANTGVTYDGSRGYVNSQTETVTIPNGCNWIAVRVLHNADNAMLNTGSTPLPYEPYGKYKIPITVGSTTKNIFINQPIRKIGNYSDSIGSDGVVTRNIKKVVLDGTETWTANARNNDLQIFQAYTNTNDGTLTASNVVCSHLETVNSSALTYSNQAISMRSSSTGFIVGISYGIIGTVAGESGSVMVEKLKSYIAAQYSAGTPVEVWYVLSTPDTTETTTIPTISTVNGANTLITQTPITPSNITISTSSSVYPKNPIYPEECGDKTANLFDYTNTTDIIDNSYIDKSDGSTVSNVQYYISYKIYLTVGQTYTWRFNNDDHTAHNAPTVAFYDSSNNIISVVNHNNVRYFSFTVPDGCTYIRASVYKKDNRQTEAVLNVGDTPINYEPYGYKIPVTIGSNTSYIYTKEPIRKIGNYADVVNSDGTITRYIKKLALTGSEGWTSGNNCYYIWLSSPTYNPPAQSIIVCSHYVGSIPRYRDGLPDKQCMITINQNQLAFKDSSFADLTAFQQFVTTQNSSGTPITAWYVMQTPTTEQTTIPTLTTVNGKNTATIGTTLAPSSITINATSKVYPNNPIIPEECGDLTENLFDINGTWIKQANTDTISVSGNTVTITSAFYARMDISLQASTTYTIEFNTSKVSGLLLAVYHDSVTTGNGIQLISAGGTAFKFNTGEYTNILFLLYASNGTEATESYSDIMLVEGDYTQQTMPPYEPYGKYKVPIINNGITQNIYLNQPIRKIGDYSDVINSDGTVTRKIQKLVMTGNEIGGYEVVSGFAAAKMRIVDLRVGSKQYSFMCSHFEVRNSGQAVNYGLVDNKYYNYYNIEFYLPSTITSTVEARAWFAELYAANNPVIFWYPLETPTTESTTTPTLTTIEGTNTLEVDTTLPPSKIDITGHIKPVQ